MSLLGKNVTAWAGLNYSLSNGHFVTFRPLFGPFSGWTSILSLIVTVDVQSQGTNHPMGSRRVEMSLGRSVGGRSVKAPKKTKDW